MGSEPEWARRARSMWQYRGQVRPPFAVVPALGQESVWDYPRPPRIESERYNAQIRFSAKGIQERPVVQGHPSKSSCAGSSMCALTFTRNCTASRPSTMRWS